MYKILHIQDGVVHGVFEYQFIPEFIGLDPRFLIADASEQHLTVGYRRLDNQWVEPQPEIAAPRTYRVTSFQAKAALANAGLLDAVQGVIDHPQTPVKVKLAWQEGLDFSRDNALLALVTDQLGMTSSQVDDLFAAASLIDPNQL